MKRFLSLMFTILWALLIWRLTTTPDFKVVEDTFFSMIISSGGHFFFFGVLAVLLFLSLPIYVWRLKSSVFAISLTSLYGLLIELVQRSIPGRSGDIWDLALDILGAIAFLAIMKKFVNFKT